MISVIIPAYNCCDYLEEAVCSALAQSYEDIEILIINDASTDKTAQTAEELAGIDPRIRLINNHKNIGVAASRNRGIDAARGEFIAFLDGDDVWQPDKLENQLYLLYAKHADLCYTGYSFIDASSREIRSPYHVPYKTSYVGMLSENVIGCSTVLMKKPDNIYMRDNFGHEDYVYWLELMKSGYKCVGIDEPLMKYRILQDSRSGNKRKAAQNRWKIYRNFAGLSIPTSSLYFIQYAIRGAIKHFRKK